MGLYRMMHCGMIIVCLCSPACTPSMWLSHSPYFVSTSVFCNRRFFKKFMTWIIDVSKRVGSWLTDWHIMTAMVPRQFIGCVLTACYVGLSGYMSALGESYTDNNVSEMMSRADYWILCSHEALSHGLSLSSTTGKIYQRGCLPANSFSG